MDYEKEYKEALERAKIFKKHLLEVNDKGYAEEIDYIFPELKESEDERIRKRLLKIANVWKEGGYACGNSDEIDDIIAWLEKQGEKPQGKSIIEAWKDMRLEVYQQASGNRHEPNCSDDNTKMFSLNDIDEIIEKINEQTEKVDNQNCVKPTDKVEPKFKVGDWVVLNENHNSIYQVEKIENYHYVLRYILGGAFSIPFGLESLMRLWTIHDAKDGDVLCCESGWTCIFKDLDNHTNTFSSYCFMDSHKWFCNTGSECHTLDKTFIKVYGGEIHPATKEQRDILFAKMKELGYEWDANKKEIHKLHERI